MKKCYNRANTKRNHNNIKGEIYYYNLLLYIKGANNERYTYQ